MSPFFRSVHLEAENLLWPSALSLDFHLRHKGLATQSREDGQIQGIACTMAGSWEGCMTLGRPVELQMKSEAIWGLRKVVPAPS